MAITRLWLVTSLLLCSLLVIVSAYDYSYDSSKNKAYDYEDKEKLEPVETEKHDYDTKQVYQPQPEKPESEKEEKPDYNTKKNHKPQPEEKEKPTSEEEEKPDYGTKPYSYKPQSEENKKPESSEKEQKPDYGTEPDSYKTQPEENKKPESSKEEENHDTKPDSYKPQPEENKKSESSEEKEKPDYGTKPDSYKPQPEETKKQESSEEEEKPDYSTKPDFNKPKSEEKEKPSYDRKLFVDEPKSEGEEKHYHYDTVLPNFYPPIPEVLPIGVQGLVLCKSGPKYYPIQGALARITCLAVDENGYEKSFSVCSGETDTKGNFFAPLSPLGLDDDLLKSSKLTECKAFLESSPLLTCNVPVDVNKGISGAPLSDFRVLEQKRMKLYSVGPFFFTSKPNSVPIPNGY
ncbi:hypothetical protein REPUB_Repub17cG0115300 [Reevesia pubescens]